MAEEGKIQKFDPEEGIVVLEEMDGEEIKFSIEEEVEIDDNKYFILVREDELDVGEGYALRLDEDDNGDLILVPVDSEEELIKVQNALEKMYQ
ncbi:DUF1292 domain-containing protein [Sporohalobacter salinus]|uniref:DUF1292 domain-containing protein n=1 Tax=Sporohalobacter salinus TaxID=1494606 RepID=UPI0019621E8B|nr:DUF1292 domain-containing protein [Sporohalobacter salinus]MBM7624657.1 hypothetical protein [Sporohalobacter salinus]